jgi:hypothetical protein
VIESRTARSFRAAFAALPEEIQAQARRAYRIFRAVESGSSQPAIQKDMIFHAPQEVLNEVSEPGQMRKVEEAVENGVLHRLKIVAVEELQSVAEYIEQSTQTEGAVAGLASELPWGLRELGTISADLDSLQSLLAFQIFSTEASCMHKWDKWAPY